MLFDSDSNQNRGKDVDQEQVMMVYLRGNRRRDKKMYSAAMLEKQIPGGVKIYTGGRRKDDGERDTTNQSIS